MKPTQTKWRLLVAVVVCALSCFLFVRPAFAQSIAVVNETSLPRLDKNGATISKRSLTLTPEAVNLQDCLDDQKIRFTLQMTGFEANASVQAWASTSGDCKIETGRSGGTQTCWKLGADIQLSSTIDVDLRVRAIMSGVGHPTAPVDNATLCGGVDLSTIHVHIMYFPPGTPTASVDKDISVIVDTVGPAPPTGITVLPGNTRIQISWANISGEGGLSELTGVKAYCDSAGAATITTPAATADAECHEEAITSDATTIDDSGDSSSSTTDAGTKTVCTDGGTTGSSTTTTTGSCSSPNFVASDGGKIFPSAEFNSKYECGNITGNSGTTAVATAVGGNPLANGTQYAVAVAATDKYGNVGPLSDVVCETPELTTDFWDDYKKAGGHAGGSFCTTTSTGAPVGSITALLLIAFVAASSLRRRSNKNKKG